MFQVIPYIFRKIDKRIKISKDHENKHFALGELSKIEGFTFDEVVFDNYKHAFPSDFNQLKHDLFDVLYNKRKIAYQILIQPIVYLIELDDGSFRGCFIPRYTADKEISPLYDSSFIAFTIDQEHGFQAVTDDRFKKHEVWRMYKDYDYRYKGNVLEVENFFSLNEKFEWSETVNGEKKKPKRVLLVFMKQDPGFELPPFLENPALKANHKEYVDRIKEDFGIDPGKIILDTAIEYPDISQQNWDDNTKNFTFLVEGYPSQDADSNLFVGFIKGSIIDKKWIKQPISAIGWSKIKDGKKNIKFCPNRLPKMGCFKARINDNGSRTIHFATEQFDGESEGYYLLEQCMTKKQREHMNDDKLGFGVIFTTKFAEYVFHETKTFCEVKGKYIAGSGNERMFKARRLLIFCDTNVSDLTNKVKESLGKKGLYSDDDDSDSSD